MEFSVFPFVPSDSCPLTEHHWEKPDPNFFAPSYQVFLHMDIFPWTFSPSVLSGSLHCQMLLRALGCTCSSMSVSLLSICLYLSYLLGSPGLGTALQMLFTSAKQRGRINSFSLLAIVLLIQPRTPLAFFDAKAHSCFTFGLVSTRTPRACSAKLPSS